MSADKNWQFELEEYIKQGEPGQIEKSEAWQTAIGLQAIDGLQTSAYLLDTAKEHIEGKISIDEVLIVPKLRMILRKQILYLQELQNCWERKHFNFRQLNG